MRTLGEILDMVHLGKEPEYEELFLALDMMQALSTFDRESLQKLSQAEKEKRKPILAFSAEYQNNERWNRWRIALDKTPIQWLGWDNNPRNPECTIRRGKILRVFEKMVKNSKTGEQEVKND